jgi:hypothetical protein
MEDKPHGTNAARQVFHGAQIRPAILPQRIGALSSPSPSANLVGRPDALFGHCGRASSPVRLGDKAPYVLAFCLGATGFASANLPKPCGQNRIRFFKPLAATASWFGLSAIRNLDLRLSERTGRASGTSRSRKERCDVCFIFDWVAGIAAGGNLV